MATLQVVAAAGMAMVVFVLMANLLVVQYGRGVVRAAVDEGARAGSHAGIGECRLRAEEVMAQLLGGPLGADVSVTCREAGGLVLAVAEGTMPGWLPGVPDIGVAAEARAPRELP